jgi:hypothetical protein
MKDYDVNFNNKTILLEGEWFNVKELGEKIKYNINKGNYKIQYLSVALEKLQEVLESAKEVKLSILGTTYDKIEEIAKKYNKGVDVIIRDIIDKYLEIDSPINDNIGLKENKEEEGDSESDIDIDIEETTEPIKVVKAKPQIVKNIDKSSKNKPSIIENKVIKSDKDIKKQPSIIVNKEDDDDWFKQ